MKSSASQAIYAKLSEFGPFGPLLSGHLFWGLRDGARPYHTNKWDSPIWLMLSKPRQEMLMRLTHREYTRAEKDWTSFGNQVLMVLTDLNDWDLYSSLFELKCWYVNTICDRNDSLGRDYLKALKTACLNVCFGNRQKSFPNNPRFPGFCHDRGFCVDLMTYFKGSLSFIAERYKRLVELQGSHSWLPKLEYKSFQICVGISLGSRSDYYGNRKEGNDAFHKVIDIVGTPPNISAKAMNAYKLACSISAQRFRRTKPTEGLSHLSTSGSATKGFPRSKGGRTAYHHKVYADLSDWIMLEDLLRFEDLYDFLGIRVLHPNMAKMLRLVGNYDSFLTMDYPVPVKHMLYVDPGPVTGNIEEISAHVYDMIVEAYEKPPKSLGNVILLSLTDSILEDMSFGEHPVDVCGYSLFTVPFLEFSMKNQFEVISNLVQETARKFRMVTLMAPWYTALSAVFCHDIRDMLRRDHSLRLGFEEAHKLWEFMKWVKDKPTDDFICSSDLNEATYRMSHALLDSHKVIYDSAIDRGPLRRLLYKCLEHRYRRIVPSEQLKKDYGPLQDSYDAHCGSFMGENTSFLDLTIFNDNCCFIAQCYTLYNYKIGLTDPDGELLLFPSEYNKVISYGVKKPPSQTAGDDLLVISKNIYSRILLGVYAELGNQGSESKWGFSPYFGTFCDNHFCVLTPEEMEAQGVPKNCRFGKFAFIDAIKGRFLNGLSKTDSSGLPAALGHGSALDTSLRWYQGPSRRIMTIFQCQNFHFIRGSVGLNLHFPPMFGGYSLPRLEGPYQYLGTDHSTDRYFRRFVYIFRVDDDRLFVYYISLLKSIRAHDSKDYPVEGVELGNKFTFLRGCSMRTSKEAFSDEGLFMPDDWRIQGDMLRDRGWLNAVDLNVYLSRQKSTDAIIWGPQKTRKISPGLPSIKKRFKKSWKLLIDSGVDPDPDLVPTDQEKTRLAYLCTLRLGNIWIRKSQIDSWFNTSFLNITRYPVDVSMKRYLMKF